MTPVDLLWFAFRRQQPIASVLSISERYLKQHSVYHAMEHEDHWRKLSEICASEIQNVTPDALVLIKAAREQVTVRALAERARRDLKRAVEAADAAKKGKKGKATQARLNELRRVLDKGLPKSNNLIAVAAGRDLARLQAASLCKLVQAEVNQAALDAQASDEMSKIAVAFWQKLQVGKIFTAVKKYQNALNGLETRIYLGALQRAPLSGPLNDLMRWVTFNISGLVRLQSTISLLVGHSAAKRESAEFAALTSAAIDVGILIRKLIASYMASLVSWLAINGTHLGNDAAEILSRARITPLHSGWFLGKRASVQRAKALPDGKLVSLQGVLSRVRFIEEKEGGGFFFAKLTDAEGGVVPVVAQFDLLAQGIGDGCKVRLSAFLRKQGSKTYPKKHVEIEKLKIREVHSEENWRMAFLNLSVPYFNMWPGSFHIGFQIFPRAAGAARMSRGGGAPAALSGPCDQLQQYYDAAQQAYDAANAAMNAATIAYYTAIMRAWTLSLGGGMFASWWGGLVGSQAALANVISEYDAVMNSINAFNRASSALDKAAKALYDCLGWKQWWDYDTSSADDSGDNDLVDLDIEEPDPPPPIPDHIMDEEQEIIDTQDLLAWAVGTSKGGSGIIGSSGGSGGSGGSAYEG